MKLFNERKQAAFTVVAASRRWGGATAGELQELLAPELSEGEEMPDLVLLQELFGRALERRWRRLETADAAQVAAIARHRRCRARMRAVLEALYRGVVGLRGLMKNVFGTDPASRWLAFTGETARDPDVLLRQADRAVERLLDASCTAPPGAFEVAAADRRRWAAPVADAAAALRPLRAGSSLAIKQVEGAEAEWRPALAAHNDVFVRVAGWLENTYRATGRDERADAVKPSRRRRGRLLKDASVAGRQRAEARGDAAAESAPQRRPLTTLRQALHRLGHRFGHRRPEDGEAAATPRVATG